MGNKQTRLKVIILCDLRTWILGLIAENVARQLNERGSFLQVSVGEYPNNPRDFYRLVKGFDVVHVLQHYDNSRGFPLSKPIVSTLHHHQPDTVDRLKPRVNQIDTFCVPNQEEMLWLNTQVQLVQKTPVFLTPYGLDTSWNYVNGARSNFCKDNGISNGTLLFGFSGKKSSNPFDRKGLDRLWLLMRSIKENIPFKSSLVLYGPTIQDSPQHGWSIDDVPSDLREIVVFPGFSSSLPDYSILDYYLCLSRYEGGPYPVIESMAQETIVFSTPVGTSQEIIVDGQNGFIVTPENFLERVPAIIVDLESDHRRKDEIAKAARRTIVSERGWEIVVDPTMYEAIYRAAFDRYCRQPWLRKVYRRRASFKCWLSAFKSGRLLIGAFGKGKGVLRRIRIQGRSSPQV